MATVLQRGSDNCFKENANISRATGRSANAESKQIQQALFLEPNNVESPTNSAALGKSIFLLPSLNGRRATRRSCAKLVGSRNDSLIINKLADCLSTSASLTSADNENENKNKNINNYNNNDDNNVSKLQQQQQPPILSMPNIAMSNKQSLAEQKRKTNEKNELNSMPATINAAANTFCRNQRCTTLKPTQQQQHSTFIIDKRDKQPRIQLPFLQTHKSYAIWITMLALLTVTLQINFITPVEGKLEWICNDCYFSLVV